MADYYADKYLSENKFRSNFLKKWDKLQPIL
jgi:hypothetical protein